MVTIIPDQTLKKIRGKAGQRGLRDLLLIELALTTALRVRELVSLTREQVQGKEWISVKVKGGRIERVYLPPKIRRLIESYLKTHSSEWLFPNGRGDHISGRHAQRIFYEIQDALNIPDGEKWNFHALRHTAITKFYFQTRDILLTRAFARHKRVETTTIYAHLNPLELARAVNQIERGW